MPRVSPDDPLKRSSVNKKPIASKLAFVTELLKSIITGRSSKGEKFDSIESSQYPIRFRPHQMIKGLRGPF